MTGEEAKKILRKLLAEDEDIDFFSYDEKEAVNHFAYLPENKGDLFSRQAVEEINSEIPKIHELFDIAYEYNKEDSTRTELSQKCTTYLLDMWQTLGAIVDNYSPVENKGEWIPVTERLPEKPYACLVTVWDTNILTQEEFENVLHYPIGYDGETWNDGDGNICPFEVIAWMPAPEPYKAESEDK